jgi:sugar lactone lactonase YvrE
LHRAVKLPLFVLMATLCACAPSAGVVSLKHAPVVPVTGIITNAGANLITGTVRGPASILTHAGGNIMVNAGANIMVNNGGNVVASGGGNWQLLATGRLGEELPVAGATVTLVDTHGQAILRAGKAITAVTDARGRYTLSGVAATGNRLVSVDLGAGYRLSAVAPSTATGEVDASLVSTLTTTYILNRFVKGQADPQGALDRLSVDLEASTRAATATALSQTGLAPVGLGEAQVLLAVDNLRKADPALDAQLERVRQVLVAGLSDLGAGRQATTVSLSRIGGIAVGADGTMVINCAWAGRLWRLTKDGRLETIAGRGTGAADKQLEGVLATQASFGYIDAVGLDAQGRALVLEDGRLTRVETDGHLKELVAASAWPKVAGRALGILALGDGQVRVVAEGGLVAVDGVAPPTLLRAFSPAQAARALGALQAGLTEDGRIWLARYEDVPVVYAYDTQGAAAPTLTASGSVGGVGLNTGVAVDPNGNVFTKDLAGRLRVTVPSGESRVLTTSFPTAMELGPSTPVALAPDGSAYYASRDNHVYHIQAGVLSAVAGISATSLPVASRPTDVAIDAPSGLVETTTGDLLVSETHAHRIMRIGQDGSARVIAGTGEGGLASDGDAAKSRLWNPSVLRQDAKGNIYVLDNTYPNANTGNFIRSISPTGELKTLYRFKLDEESVRDFAVTADGGIFVSVRVRSADQSRIVYYAADGSAPVQVSAVALDHNLPSTSRETLAVAHDGTLYIAGLGRLAKWTAASGLVTLETDPVYALSSRFNGLCVDDRGRCYMANQNTILRRDPALHTTEVLGGTLGGHFNGSTVDDGLLEPTNPYLTRAGNLVFLDREHRQIKAIAAPEL